MMVFSKNSPDLDMGRRPELKPAELFKGTILVIKLASTVSLKPSKQFTFIANVYGNQTRIFKSTTAKKICITRSSQYWRALLQTRIICRRARGEPQVGWSRLRLLRSVGHGAGEL